MDTLQYYIRLHSVKSWNFSEIFQISSGIILDYIQEISRLLSDNLEKLLDFPECDPKYYQKVFIITSDATLKNISC